MAEVLPEKLNSENKVYQVRIESVVNGWLVDYYFFLAVEFFKNEQYEDFCAIIDILDCKYNPLPSTDDIAMKFRVLQFISRINEGENLGVSFEMDVPSTPLESALMLLEKISQEFSIPQQDDLWMVEPHSTVESSPTFSAFVFLVPAPSSGQPPPLQQNHQITTLASFHFLSHVKQCWV
uniref:Telomere repeat-binding factor dimerisation domain-containing protein n=1 Tax=Oreochromis niloticus TaxID=8128 RepID=A0A669AWM3_ORENI